MTAVVVAGFALQIFGVVVSAIGFRRTWHEFATPGEDFFGWLFGPVGETLARAWASVESLVRRVLRRPKPIVLTPDPAELRLRGLRPSVRIGYGKLSDDPAAALAELHRRTQELMDKVSVVDEHLAQEADGREAAIAAVRRDLNAAAKQLEQHGQRIAIGGIRAQTLGLTLIGLGLVLHMWAFWAG